MTRRSPLTNAALIAAFVVSPLAFAPSAFAMSHSRVVRVAEGELRGHESGRTWVFKGVPFAAPPIESRRWRAPEPALPWTGVREARDKGPECLQPNALSDHPGPAGSEDCLTLNIWAPRDVGPESLPVMVFIHGGFFSVGDKDGSLGGVHLFSGRALAEKGHVIVATINYRLSIFGFLAHGALSRENGGHGSGNYGLLDQIQALRWIQANAAAFGGDPSKVTVFGQSAGAASVLALSASPLARGLFRGAIAQSGYLTRPLATEAEAQGDRVAWALGCADAADVPACLRALPARTIVSTFSNSQSSGRGEVFQPNVGGEVLPVPVAEAFAHGSLVPSALIVGSNSLETSTLYKDLYGDEIHDADGFAAKVTRVAGPGFWRELKAVYNKDRFGSYQDAFMRLSTDAIFTCSARTALRAASKGSPSSRLWRYVFDHTSRSSLLHKFGPGHGLELPYVFHFVPRIPIFGFSGEEAKFSDSVIARWTHFAATGEADWPEYAPADGEAYLNLDLAESIGRGYRNDDCDAIDRASEAKGLLEQELERGDGGDPAEESQGLDAGA